MSSAQGGTGARPKGASADQGRQRGSNKQKWVPKGDEKDEHGADSDHEEDTTEYVEYDTKNEGPHYDRQALIRAMKMYKKAMDKGEAVVEALKTLTTGARPAEHVADEKAIADAMRKKKRTSSMADDGEHVGRDPSMSATLSEGVTMDPRMMQWLQMQWMTMSMPGMYSQGYTTVMLRNIPNRYTRDMLVEVLNKSYEKQFDFVYLPIDFNSKCNVGYAFINFRHPSVAHKFMTEFHQANCAKVLPGFSSQKVVEVCYARVQGKEQNMENLRDEKFIEKLNEHVAWQPLFLDEDDKEIPFSKTLGSKSEKRPRGRTSSGSLVTPLTSGYMMPPWYPMTPYGVPPPAPAITLGTVLSKATPSTMLMVKGVPTTMSREAVLEVFNKKFKGQVDFLFVPGGRAEGTNRGHCFVNLRKEGQAKKFTEEYNGKPVAEIFGVEDAEGRNCDVQPARMESIEHTIVKLQSTKQQKGDKGEKKERKKSDKKKAEGAEKGEGAEKAEEADKEKEKETEQAKEKGTEKTEEAPKVEKEESAGAKQDTAAWQPLLLGTDGATKAFPQLTGQAGASSSAPGKGKGKGKGGKDKGANAAAAVAAMGYGYGYSGYYGGYYNQAAYAAYQRQAYQVMQQAHANAVAAAAAHAGGGMLENLGAAMKSTGRGGKALNPDQKEAIRKQVDFYFSQDNLCKDLYLRQHMDGQGWASLDLISTFNQIRKYNTTVESIAEACSSSELLQVDAKNRRIRLKDVEQRKKWTRARA